MDKAKAKELYETSLAAGYPFQEARDRTFKYLKTGEVEPDPTDAIWGATIHQESGGNQKAVSPKGATGVAQVMPSTGPEAAKLAGREWDPVAFKKDKAYNEAIGRAYMRQQFKDFGSAKLALAAYNAGPERVRRVLAGESTLPAETQNYVASITGKSKMADDPKVQAKAIYDQMVSKGASSDEIRAAIGKVLGKPAKTASAPVASQPAVAQAVPQGAPAQPDAASRVSHGAGWQAAPGSNIDRLQNQVEQDGVTATGGAERSLLGTIQGARKLYNQATGDQHTVDQINAQNQRSKDYWEKVDPSGSGPSMADVGRFGTDVATYAAAPGGGATAAGRIAAGVGTGAVQGLLAPTTAEDSQAGNAAIGGVLGGAIPGMGSLLRKVIGTANPEKKAAADALRQAGVKVPRSSNYESPLGNMIGKAAGETGQDMSPALTAEIARLTGAPELSNDVLENQLRQTGSKIGDLSKGLTADPDLKFASTVHNLRTKYLREGLNATEKDGVPMAAQDLLSRASQGPMEGELIQKLRAQLGGLATHGTPQDKAGYKGLQGALDDLIQPSLEQAGKGGDKEALNAQYRMLKLLRGGKGIPAEGVTPGALSNKIETASNKGAVSGDLRDLLRNAATVAPKTRLGADPGSDGVERLIDRPQGWLNALMKVATVPANGVMKTGLIQAIMNNKATGKAASETARNALLPILLRLNSGE